MNTKLKSKFTYEFMYIKDKRVAIVVDHALNGPYASVTNDIGNIAEVLDCDKILYSDSTEEWVFWTKESGYLPVVAEGGNGVLSPIYDKNEAIAHIDKWL